MYKFVDPLSEWINKFKKIYGYFGNDLKENNIFPPKKCPDWEHLNVIYVWH